MRVWVMPMGASPTRGDVRALLVKGVRRDVGPGEGECKE